MKRTYENLHSHTIYCDGKNTVEEMVETAIQKGFTVLGFSGHGYYEPEDFTMNDTKETMYKKDILQAKEKYKNDISIYLGVEEELDGKRYTDPEYDFVIGSVHVLHKSVDESREIMEQEIEEYYEGNFKAYAKDYYQKVAQYAKRQEADIIGHLDLLMKYNEDERFCSFEDPEYLKYAFDCIDTLIEADKIFEINTGAIARGYRKTPYPHISLLKYIHDHGGKICINSDCHDKNYLDCAYDLAYQLARKAGFTKKMVLTPDGFKEKNL